MKRSQETMIYHRGQTTTLGTLCPTLMNIESLRERAYGLSSSSEKTRESNHLQMSLQRQTPSVAHGLPPAWHPGGQLTDPPVRGYEIGQS